LHKGIEGARGWLALIVVAAHLVLITPLVYLPSLWLVLDMARWAVETFIIISGFVITHILVEKRETYGLYIARRALRIYPAYLVALLLGLAAAGLPTILIDGYPRQPPHEMHHYFLASLTIEKPVHQLLLDLALLQGLMPWTQFGYVPAAWSLSLEWQYYLVAPLFVMAVRARPLATSAAVALAVAAYQVGLFGNFARPSILVGAGWFFLIGTLSRLYLDRLPRFAGYPALLVLAAAPILLIARDLVPVLAWSGLLIYMRSDAQWRLLDGRLARYLGSRSYAIYILHFAIITAAASLAWRGLGLATEGAVLFTCIGGGIAVLAVADIVCRWVERPAINFGRRLAREPAPGLEGW
jgi:peptidoglycan/LPS O-acetylase OafA/YrhL